METRSARRILLPQAMEVGSLASCSVDESVVRSSEDMSHSAGRTRCFRMIAAESQETLPSEEVPRRGLQMGGRSDGSRGT